MNTLSSIGIYLYIISFMLLPFTLVAGLIRVFLPNVKVLRLLSLLSVMITLLVDTKLHFFLNPVNMDEIVTDVIRHGMITEFGKQAQYCFMGLFFLAAAFGSVILPLLFARSGVAIVDKVLRIEKRIKDVAMVNDGKTVDE